VFACVFKAAHLTRSTPAKTCAKVSTFWQCHTGKNLTKKG